MSANQAQREADHVQPNDGESLFEISKRFYEKREGLTAAAIKTGGEIAYIGKLVVAVPNERNWLRLYDSNSRLIGKRNRIARKFVGLRK